MVSEHTDLTIPLSDDFIVPTHNDIGATSRTDGGKLPHHRIDQCLRVILNEPRLYPENRCIYLCGNSLGLQSKTSTVLIQEELDVWATRWVFFWAYYPHHPLVEIIENLFLPTLWLKLRGVLGHFTHPQNRPWTKCTDEVHPLLAELVGRL